MQVIIDLKQIDNQEKNMNKTVERFSDEYAFLSNLYPYKKNLQGKICRFIVKYQN